MLHCLIKFSGVATATRREGEEAKIGGADEGRLAGRCEGEKETRKERGVMGNFRGSKEVIVGKWKMNPPVISCGSRSFVILIIIHSS